MPFETKKIKTETLAEYLLGTRKFLKMSLRKVNESTGIPVKFLEFLESGKYDKLPPTVYAAGFLSKLAKLYHVSYEALIAQFKKERTLSLEISKERPKKQGLVTRLKNNFLITPKSLSLAAGAFFIVVTVVYLVFEVFSIYGTPRLSIAEPRDGQKINSSAVNVSGKTEPGVSLTINDQPVFVDSSDGSFHTVVSVAPGQKDLLFVASNKFNKINTQKLSLLVDSSIGQQKTQTNLSDFTLTLNFTDTADVTLVIDGRAPVSETMVAGSSKVVTASSKILLSTTNAGATLAKYNNKNLGALGKKYEILTNIPFTSESAGIILSSKNQSLETRQ